MPRRTLPGIALAIAVLQSLLALGIWVGFGVVVSSIGPGVDYQKPNHQVSIFEKFAEPALLIGPLLVCLTLAAILSWRNTKLGWWFSVASDLVLAVFGVIAFVLDIPRLPELIKYPGLRDDILYHLVLFVLPLTALMLLFRKSVRLPVFAGKQVAS